MRATLYGGLRVLGVALDRLERTTIGLMSASERRL